MQHLTHHNYASRQNVIQLSRNLTSYMLYYYMRPATVLKNF